MVVETAETSPDALNRNGVRPRGARNREVGEGSGAVRARRLGHVTPSVPVPLAIEAVTSTPPWARLFPSASWSWITG